jgi:general secretion pathway protein F
MRFEVRALDAQNVITSLSIEAVSEAEAARQVQSQSLRVLQVRAGAADRWGARRGRFALLLFSQELHALLNAGLGLVESLQGLAEKASSQSGRGASSETQAVLDHLLARLRAGQRFSSALAELPRAFPPLFVGLMQAAETTGELPRALARYIDYQQRVDAVRGKVLSASIYPAILLMVGSAVTLFLAGYVVPKFAAVYQDTGRPLPWASQLLLSFGQFVGQHFTSVALGAGLGVAAIVWGVLRAVRAGALATLAARLPWVGDRVRLYELSRLYLTLGLLLESGVPAVAAMAMSQGVASGGMAAKLQAARAQVQAGASFSQSLDEQGLTTPISLRMLRVGEQSGQLGRMLMEAAAFYDGDVARFIDRFTRAFEPLLMAAIGLVVGAIVMLLYMPIFDLAGSFE